MILDVEQPIPLELLLIAAPDELNGQTARPQTKALAKTLTKRNSFNRNAPPPPPAIIAPKSSKDGYSITFVHLGRKFYQLTLWASTQVNRRKWLDVLRKQQETMRLRSLVFDTITLSEGFFVGPNRVNCAAPFGTLLRVVSFLSFVTHLSYQRLRKADSVWY